MKHRPIPKKELQYLTRFVKTGHQSARTLTRARVLLLASKDKPDKDIQTALQVGRTTIWRIKLNYAQHGLAFALTEKPRPGQPKKYDDKKNAEIVAYACTTPPAGRKRWTVRLLAEEIGKKQGFKTINRETIRLVLKKTRPNPG